MRVDAFGCDTCGALAKAHLKKGVGATGEIMAPPKTWCTKEPPLTPSGRRSEFPSVHTCRNCMKDELEKSQHEVMTVLARKLVEATLETTLKEGATSRCP